MKVNFSFDSESKAHSVTIDDKVVNNVSNLGMYSYMKDDGTQAYCLDIGTNEYDEDGFYFSKRISWCWTDREDPAQISEYTSKVSVTAKAAIKKAINRK